MSNDDRSNALPEIAIEGDPNRRPEHASDWWCEGFTAGYNARGTPIARPLMINDELAASFWAGAATGKQAQRELQASIDAELSDQPALGPERGGELFDEVQKRYREAWEELFHQHMPHIEVEGEPEVEFSQPNIVPVAD